jgi:uncharacterized protein
MPLSLSAASIGVFTDMLNALSGVLKKAESHAAAKKLDPDALLKARLFPDMFHVIRQTQVACDFAKGASARLAGVEVPSYADDETTFEGLQARVAKTLAFIGGLSKEAIDGAADRTVTLKLRGEERSFPGAVYLLSVATPNFYFHVTAVYAILRANGVELGKSDFLGR